MSGALLQISSLGPQDTYLTGNPEITLFKKVYMRYTNFSLETVQVTFDGGSINFGDTATVTLEQTGDLISKAVLVITLDQITSNALWGYVDRLGHAMIDNITVSIGQSTIDIHTFDWIDTYHNLYTNQSHEERYNTMIGNTPVLKQLNTVHPSYNLYIPLNFWFCKTSTSTFPICSLKNQKFQINVTLKNATDIINYSGITPPISSDLPTIASGYLLVDYIYLENSERNLFQTNNHEYLIEQVQDMTDTLTAQTTKISLTFDKPCKYMIWFANLYKYYTRTPYLAWAYDDKWDVTRDLFAKIVWLATRQGLDCNDPINPIINFGVNFVNIGQVPSTIVGGNSILETLASKVNALILFAEYENGDIIAKANPDNVILTKNTITMEDMSYTVDEINAATVQSTPDQINFMDIYTISIIDWFNTGNFINRTDNPIVQSSFQINGKNKFQPRDAYFYNYLQPYYYFTNTPPDGINAYSFSLDPENVQPTGTINLTYINSKDLLVTLGRYNNTDNTYFNTYFKQGQIRIFTLSYTYLKIFEGNAALAY